MSRLAFRREVFREMSDALAGYVANVCIVCGEQGGEVEWPSPYRTVRYGDTDIPVYLKPMDLLNVAIDMTCHCGGKFRAVLYSQQRIRQAT